MGPGSSNNPEDSTPGGPSRREQFREAVAIEDQDERLLEAAGIIHAEMAEIGYTPISVGGLAVAYWAPGVDTTSDIDAVTGVPEEELHVRLCVLGMERVGRVWSTPDRRVSFDRPGLVLDRGWKAIDAESPHGRPLRVLSLEDTIISRMHDLDGGGHLESFSQALTMLKAPGLDRGRLEARARSEKLEATLKRLDWAADEIENGRHFEAWEVHRFFPTFGTRPTL